MLLVNINERNFLTSKHYIIIDGLKYRYNKSINKLVKILGGKEKIEFQVIFKTVEKCIFIRRRVFLIWFKFC